MEVSLGFHMIFAALGIALPLLLLIAEGLGLRTGEARYFRLARQWGRATALLFAIGAVSGTALSFELGLLWPGFMELAGPFVGPAFTLEAFAFFTEAIFIGLYLYGWDRLSPRAHWLTAFPIAVSGALSGLFVVAANSWMQSPGGFEIVQGQIVATDALAAFRTPFWIPMAFHLLVACYVAGGFAVAAVYAVALLRGRGEAYHRSALGIAMFVAVSASLLLPWSGDASANAVAESQPIKLAAMEGLFETQAGAPFTLGGIPDPETRTTRWGVEIPYLLSLLATRSADGVVEGLEAFPREEWPPVAVTHIAFQIMILIGGFLVALALWFTWRWGATRGRIEGDRWLLRAVVAAGPLAFLAVEAGWVVTEVGRQPWTVYGILRTEDAVTSAPGVLYTLVGFVALYLGLSAALIFLLRYLAHHPPPTPRAGRRPVPA